MEDEEWLMIAAQEVQWEEEEGGAERGTSLLEQIQSLINASSCSITW